MAVVVRGMGSCGAKVAVVWFELQMYVPQSCVGTPGRCGSMSMSLGVLQVFFLKLVWICDGKERGLCTAHRPMR